VEQKKILWALGYAIEIAEGNSEADKEYETRNITYYNEDIISN
jgi:hypothetical protein